MTRTASPPAHAGVDWRGFAAQALVIALLGGVAYWLIDNTLENLRQRQVTTGFDFLWQVSGLPIADSHLDYDPTRSTFGEALLVGFINTITLSLATIVTATIAGTALGLASLSPNWMAASLAALYVGIVRNVPALLVVLFTMSQMRRLGPPRQAIELPGGAVLSNRGLVLPALEDTSGLGWVVLAALAGLAAAAWVGRGRTGRRTGMLAGALTGMALGVLFAPVDWRLSTPELRGFNFVGGTVVSLEFAAMLVALTAYFAAYVAETVRAGVQSVPRGQWDAAASLGLSRGRTLRLVVIPLALRAVVPPLTNSYLGIVKASALGVAIGFQELVSVTNTALSVTGQSVELVVLQMVAYLIIGLTIGGITHWYNERQMRRELR